MSPSGVPQHISIDFREALDPARAWIVGVGEAPSRVELLAFEQPLTDAAGSIASIDSALTSPGLGGLAPRPRPATMLPDVVVVSAADESACTCPDYCERDHDND